MLIIVLIAAAVWSFIALLVLAMCKAAARADSMQRPLRLLATDERRSLEVARPRLISRT